MRRSKKSSSTVHVSAADHSEIRAQPTDADEAAQSVARNPIPRMPLQLPTMTPDQAYLLLDAIEWLHAAIWNAHEGALVDLQLTRVDLPPAADSGDASGNNLF